MDRDKGLEIIKMKKLREILKNRDQSEGKTQSKMDKPINLYDRNFEEFIIKNHHVVVDCWAPWCGPCRMISPIIDELALKYSGKIFFGKLNVDENPLTARQYGIMSIPTLLIFTNGILMERIIGASPKGVIESKITRHLHRN